MFDKIANELINEFMRPKKPGPRQIVVQIPKKHPRAEALMRLARALATRETLESGVIVDHFAGNKDADLEFIEALREFGVDVDRIKAMRNAPAQAESEHLAGFLTKAHRLLPIIKDKQGR